MTISWRRQFQTLWTKLCGPSWHANKMKSSCIMVTLCGTVRTRFCVKPSSIHWFHTRINVVAACHIRVEDVTVWQTCFPETNYSARFERTHGLILHPSSSTRHTCVSFYVYISFGGSELTEQCITMTLLETQETSLCIRYFSGNVINYWCYIDLNISRLWIRSGHFILFMNNNVFIKIVCE